MKIQKLMDQLKSLDPDAEVVLRGEDHSYYRVSRADYVTAGNAYGDYYEWYGEESAHEDEVPEKVLVIHGG